MGINFTTMKFTVAALLIATTSAVQIQDDCGGKWCNKGLAYDFDEPTRNAAHADKVAKDHAFNGATKAHDESASQQAAANAGEAATKAADAAAGAAKADTAAAFAGTGYKTPAYPGAEAAKNAAVTAKEGTSMPILRLSIPKLKRTLLRPESKEILMPPPLPRPLLMPSSLPTMPELHGRRISSREVRTRTDLRKSTRTPLPRPPKLTASTTRER